MKNRIWILLLALILALCAVSGWLLLGPGEEADQAQVWSEGELLYTLNLRIDGSITVQSALGTNVITVRDGKIGVTEADCPDGYCMHRGFCAGGADIVCLPNRLVICFVEDQGVDTVIG